MPIVVRVASSLGVPFVLLAALLSGCAGGPSHNDAAFWADKGLDDAVLADTPEGWHAERVKLGQRYYSADEPLVLATKGNMELLAKEDGRAWLMHVGPDAWDDARLRSEVQAFYAALGRPAPVVSEFNHACTGRGCAAS